MEDPVKYETIPKKKMDDFCEEGIKEIGHEDIQPKLTVNSILLDFLLYPDIYAEIKAQAELTKLPLSHIIFNLLSSGIMTAHEEEERRRNGVQRKEFPNRVQSAE